MPNLAQIYPEVNNESSILNEDNFPTLDLLTVEMVRQQLIPSNTTITSRRKRLALTHQNRCRPTKTKFSIQELNLEQTILYPKTLTIVSCQGFCHKQQVIICNSTLLFNYTKLTSFEISVSSGEPPLDLYIICCSSL